jgi:RNA polymerase sigma-54 factor
MALTQKLDIKLGQGLVMTPQLQMAIKLLQMPMIDLNEFIDSEILENPFLQKDDGVTEVESSAEFETKTADTADHLENTSMDASDDNLALDHSWDNMYESPNMGASASGGSFNETDDSYWENTATKEVTLKDHLTTQLGEAISTPKELFIGHYLIDAIDDAGYMQADISHMAERLKLKEHQITKILSLIQTFEPAGVGARNLAECLRLQLISNNAYTEAHDVILDNL